MRVTFTGSGGVHTGTLTPSEHRRCKSSQSIRGSVRVKGMLGTMCRHFHTSSHSCEQQGNRDRAPMCSSGFVGESCALGLLTSGCFSDKDIGQLEHQVNAPDLTFTVVKLESCPFVRCEEGLGHVTSTLGAFGSCCHTLGLRKKPRTYWRGYEIRSHWVGCSDLLV